MGELLDEIKAIARRNAESGASGDDLAPLRAKLRGCEDAAALRRLGERWLLHAPVAVALLERAVELAPADCVTRARLGAGYWLLQDDARARAQLEAARKVDPRHVGVLLLEACMEKDPARAKALCRKVLEIDPGNAAATAQLEDLDKAR